AAEAAAAQWSQVHDQFYYPAKHNWAFRKNYRTADRLFNAFDYGHAILYEELYTRPGAPAERLEEKQYDFITKKLLVKPPRVPLEEGAIEVAYAKIAPEAKMMFDWAHVLHRQIYDVWADERIPLAEKDAKIAELLRYYKSRPDVAFSSVPKSMELMEGQYYSSAFRERYPKFNGLIWAYHWLQIGLYEPLVTHGTLAERQTGVTAAVARFWQMLDDAPTNLPRLMPMTAAVAPEFAKRYPEAAIIFDNLHAMHDVISDILASPKVPKDKKRAEILKAAERYRDSTSFAMTEQEWQEMALMMGAQNMGGVAGGVLTALPEPTVALGASHAEAMRHHGHAVRRDGGEARDTSHVAHGGAPLDTATARGEIGTERGGAPAHQPADHMGMEHEMGDSTRQRMQVPPGGMVDSTHIRHIVDTTHMGQMMELHMRMMADSIIRQRVMADTAMRRLISEMMDNMPAEHREHMRQLKHGALGDTSAPTRHPHGAKHAAPRKPARTSAKPADPRAGHTPPPTEQADPHAGHDMTPGKPVTKDSSSTQRDSMPGMDYSNTPDRHEP
ncbi:MAG: hypothetical protein M3336_02675, partial [Chloroflexota bacterium]|nr:hypothetical protein [Chloroflexota bacterium]